MPDKTLAQKLAIKPEQTVLLVNAPAGYKGTMGELPAGAKFLKSAAAADAIQVFVNSKQELEAQLTTLKALLRPNGMLWVTYHKGTSKVKTDINRDTIAAYAQSIGLRAVAMIAIDEDWAALRLKFA